MSALLVGLVMLGVIAVVMALLAVAERVLHRRWIADIEREEGPAAAQIADAEFAAGRAHRGLGRWLG